MRCLCGSDILSCHCADHAKCGICDAVGGHAEVGVHIMTSHAADLVKWNAGQYKREHWACVCGTQEDITTKRSMQAHFEAHTAYDAWACVATCRLCSFSTPASTFTRGLQVIFKHAARAHVRKLRCAFTDHDGWGFAAPGVAVDMAGFPRCHHKDCHRRDAVMRAAITNHMQQVSALSTLRSHGALCEAIVKLNVDVTGDIMRYAVLDDFENKLLRVCTNAVHLARGMPPEAAVNGDTLPSEIWGTVMQFMDLQSLGRLASTCWRLRAAADYHVPWLRLAARHMPGPAFRCAWERRAPASVLRTLAASLKGDDLAYPGVLEYCVRRDDLAVFNRMLPMVVRVGEADVVWGALGQCVASGRRQFGTRLFQTYVDMVSSEAADVNVCVRSMSPLLLFNVFHSLLSSPVHYHACCVLCFILLPLLVYWADVL